MLCPFYVDTTCCNNLPSHCDIAYSQFEQFEVNGYPWVHHDSLQSVTELVESASADIDVTLCEKCLVDEPLVCRTVFGGNILYLNCGCLFDEARHAELKVLMNDEHFNLDI